jgi:hypothetical protein
MEKLKLRDDMGNPAQTLNDLRSQSQGVLQASAQYFRSDVSYSTKKHKWFRCTSCGVVFFEIQKVYDHVKEKVKESRARFLVCGSRKRIP